MASTITVPNETNGASSRITREGRKITYRLNVIQQPERARACGQGAKAATDRRPVDPPPIVELRVFEGEGDHPADITFSYGANFFLYTTLENARTIAHGRMPQPSNHSPVLTGMPVAGMCYLDRPSPAGYFTFPDLSVRHEGKYRMKFTLYEELKDPKDFDIERKDPIGQNTNLDSDTNVGSAHARCDVHSAPFNVYSAKKFPGLNESTPLSRLVADQGCRVRIRRDVRMRRRDPKDSKDWDNYEEETADLRARQTDTPDTYKQGAAGTPHPEQTQRPRSVSNASNASYDNQTQRSLQRTASQEVVYQPSVVQQHNAPPTPQHGLAPGYNNYEQHPGYASHYMQQQQQHQHQAAASPHPQQIPPHFAQGPQQGAYAAYQQQPTMHMQNGYGYPAHMAQQHNMYEQQQMNTAHYQQPQHPSSVDPRSPVAMTHSQPPNYDYSRMHGAQGQAILPMANPSLQATPGQSVPFHRPIDSTPSAQTKHEPTSPTTYDMHNYRIEARPPPSQYVTAPTVAGAPAPKRSFGAVFNTAHTEGSLRAGARPNMDYSTHNGVGLGLLNGAGGPGIDDGNNSDDEMELNMANMSYRRADGRSVRVPWPGA